MAGAAFFDLDRTVLNGGSGPAFTRALREVGLAPENDPPGLRQVLALFDLVGESRISMALVRQGIRLTKGWSAEDFQRAAELALEELIDQVHPFAPALLAEHRDLGHQLVLATTSPHQLVTPLADHLGFDDVVATRYASTAGSLTGSIDGEFVWGRGKLTAVRQWAAEHGVDVSASWAYSDSFYDAPLLDAVGHGVAANPDPRLAVLARLKGWPIRHLDKPPGTAKVGPYELQQLLQPLLSSNALPFARFEIEGEGHVPSGAAIVAANHRSYFDIAAVAVMMARRGRPLRFLGKAELFDIPMVGDLASALGGIRVDRGSGASEPLDAAITSLGAGEAVGLMPQGTIPRGPAFFEPVLEGRHGVARLAAASGAPVIPVGLWGTDVVWPRSAKMPALRPTSRPLVTVRVGPAVEGLDGDLAADTRRVMAAIEGLLPPEARERRDPTPEELALTYPPGHGAASGEATATP